VLRFLLDALGEGRAVPDDRFDRQGSHDGAERTGQGLLRVVVDRLLLVEEALGGLTDGVRITTHLDLGDAGEVELDAVLGDAFDAEGDLA
jgi:hypothetical protein